MPRSTVIVTEENWPSVREQLTARPILECVYDGGEFIDVLTDAVVVHLPTRLALHLYRRGEFPPEVRQAIRSAKLGR